VDFPESSPDLMGGMVIGRVPVEALRAGEEKKNCPKK